MSFKDKQERVEWKGRKKTAAALSSCHRAPEQSNGRRAAKVWERNLKVPPNKLQPFKIPKKTF